MTYPLQSSSRYQSVTLDAGDTVIDLGTGDGISPFPVIEAADLVVIRVRDGAEELLTLDADYALGNLDQIPGPRIFLAQPAVQDDRIVAFGARPIRRPTDLYDGQRFNDVTLNSEFDNLTIQQQELRRDVDRAWKNNYGVPGGVIASVPEGHFWMADAAGNMVDGGSAADIANAQAYAAEAAAARDAAQQHKQGAEAAQAAAEAAQAAAEGAAAGVHLPIIGSGDAGKSLVVKQTEDGYELLDERGVVRVANRTALKALDGTKTPVAYLYGEGGRNGTFVWNPGNFSAGVAADPAEAIYVPPASDPTGASGAWVRQNPMVGVPNFGATRRMVQLSWFGMSATASAADNTAAFDAFMAFAGGAAGAIGILPAGVLQVNTLLINASNTLVEGHKDGTWLVNNTTNAPAVRIQPASGTAFFSGIGRVTIAQAAGVTPVTGNCGVRVQNTFHASVYDIVCTQYPAALHRGFIFDNADESLIENLIATNCLGDGFYFGNGCSGASGHTLKAFSNGGAGLMFDGVSGFWVNSVHAFGNGTFGILFNHTSGRVNQFFFCSGWIADTSGQSNWQIANLNRSSFSNSWAATQKNTVDFPGACGILITSANVFDVDLIGMQVLNNNSHGLLIQGGAENVRVHGGTYGANPTTGHGNGRAGSGSGIRIALATDITVTGTRCRGNASNGLITEAVASDYLIITNNNLRGNTGTSLNDNSTGTNNVLANNIV